MAETLSEQIERIYSCKARHVRSAEICKLSAGRTIWDGVVEVFELTGHPQAKRCYAWKHWEDLEGEHDRVTIVLGVSPIDSPNAAIRSVFGTTQLRRVPRRS